MEYTRAQLEEVIKTEFGLEEISALVGRQISQMRLKHGFTYKQVARAIVFYMQVKKGKYEAMYGIGFIPNVIPESEAYFERLKRERDARLKSLENKEDVSNIILKPQMKKRKKISFTRETEE